MKLEKVRWDVSGGFHEGLVWGVRGREIGDAKICILAGQGRRSLFQGYLPGALRAPVRAGLATCHSLHIVALPVLGTEYPDAITRVHIRSVL